MDWLEKELHREYHEIASLFPLMEGEEFEALKADIAENGLLEPIWLHPDGRIIDGRNRHRACIEMEMQPEFRTWSAQGSLLSLVVSLNFHRRHLTYDQRVGIALKLEEEYAVLAKTSQGTRTDIAPSSEQCFGRAAVQAAQEMKVGKNAVYEMKAAQDDNPKLAEKLIAGDEPFWEAIYRKAFPGMLWCKLCSGNTEGQHRGVDRLIYLPNDRVLRIDEKKREEVYTDILLEYMSVDATNAPGWIEKDLAIDYLAYAFMPTKTVYLFDWLMLRRAWLKFGNTWKSKAKQEKPGYRLIEAKNNGYSTWSVAIPIDTLRKAVSSAKVIQL